MKRRQGFVSNSSSSSFIVAYKRSEVCESCGRGGEDPLGFIKNGNSYCETEVVENGTEDVIKRVNDWYCLNSEEQESLISDIKLKDKEGYNIASIDIDYNDEALQDMLLKSNDITILKRYE